jgi:ribosomal protein S18 acetylase RimI-like enzyme
MPESTIRPYQPADREVVFRIAADTAFFGEPVEAFFEDRHLFCEAFYRAYTDLETEQGWVACAGDNVVGFLMGCTDTVRLRRRLPRQILPETFWQILRGHYHIGARTRRYALGLALGALRGEFFQANPAFYPAHLHVNLARDWRGRGLGRRLIGTFLDELRRLSISGVHIHTTSLNRAACRLYEKLGFCLLDSRPTRLWEYVLDQPVRNLCYGLRIFPSTGGTP